MSYSRSNEKFSFQYSSELSLLRLAVELRDII